MGRFAGCNFSRHSKYVPPYRKASALSSKDVSDEIEMLPIASKPSTTTTKKSDGYQVLNISNVNAQNEVVLNDEQLLALIQQYPFLYNQHVLPHNDADYDAWAWEQITKAFNRTYENLPDRNVWYTKAELTDRWKVLQPIVRSLSKINNIKSLPDTLRQTVVKMSVPMDEKPNDSLKKPLTNAQKTLLEYEPFVKTLPIEKRRCLEAEMMELILNSELDSKATLKVGHSELQIIEKDYNEFLQAIGLDDLYMFGQNNNDINSIQTLPQDCINVDIVSNGNTIPLSHLQNNIDTEKESVVGSVSSENKLEAEENEESENKLEAEENEDSLLEPMVNRRWVPLDRWREHVRKCRVLVKRIIMEDDLPLAVIKREKLEKDSSKDFILPD